MVTKLLARSTFALSSISAHLPEYHVSVSNALLLLGASWFVATIVRRSYFTSLYRIPGPLLNSFTNMPLAIHVVCGTSHKYAEKLHSRYGPVVRVGHNQVSVSGINELKHILSTHDFPKGPTYNAMRSMAPSIFSTTDPNLNKLRRRQMGNSYSLPSVRLYEDKILEHGVFSLISLWDRLIAKSPSKKNALVNFHYGFHGMAFDIIGILGFGKSFNILATGDTKIIDGVLKLAKLASLKSRVPFNEQLGRLVRDWVDGRNYVLAVIRDTIVKRKQDNAETACTEEKSGTEHMDLLQKLVNARDPFSGEPIDDESLIAEVSVLLVGGTDTTSNTLTWAMLCLLNRPDVYERLKTEVRMAFPDKRTVIRSDDAKSKLPYLTAVLYEVMRLHPAVGGYLPRAVPKEGAHLVNGEYFIPHGTEICVSLFACHRNKDTWNNPTEFDPDRFMGPDSEARMKDVLVFSSGVRICAGRHLAIVELYTALANLILRYDFKLPDGKEPCRHSVAEIQGSAYFNYSPNNTDKECWMIVSHAK